MLARFHAVQTVMNTPPLENPPQEPPSKTASTHFGIHVFNRMTMQKMLPREIYHNIVNAMEGKEKIRAEFADPIAVAMKEWAVAQGATHFCHWFQPLTGAFAEKHDAFIEWNSPDQVIEQFTGKQLIQGEPDASSFPSGGLRSTFEARGYTGWDPTSPAFLWKEGKGVTLCIPSVFFSWTGDVLDSKIPFHRSEKKLNAAVMHLLELSGIQATKVHVTIGLEQEYFVIDRGLRNLRPDLLLAGRTVFGAPSPKGQELQDHYFGSVKERILRFMQDFEAAAFKLGIPVKARHNEVAPAQHEVTPVAERATVGIDHNIQLMELMRKTALKHNLAVLLHEKPFQGINGSGKHCNWSIATDTGINLLDPTDTPGNNFHFLVLLTAIIEAVHRHSALLRASIGSAGNDYRLGSHEAPPAIISVYLGEAIEAILNELEEVGIHHKKASKNTYDLGIHELPDLTKDYTDRNRTSPFAFTGNKFEYRALGSSANPAMAVTVLNAILAESLERIVLEIKKNLNHQPAASPQQLMEAAIPVLQRSLKVSKPIRFSGDNYSAEWVEEAKRRGLPNLQKSVEAYRSLLQDSTIRAFEGILTPGELKSRYEILVEHYAHVIHIEAKLMLDLFRTQVLPAALKYQEAVASGIHSLQGILEAADFETQTALLQAIVEQVALAGKKSRELGETLQTLQSLPVIERAEAMCQKVLPLMRQLRASVDQLENHIDDTLWPLPKYRELLFLV